MTKLLLDRRGMDFLKDSPESKVSDLENYRYFADFGHGYCAEIGTHYREQKGKVDTHIEIDFTDSRGFCQRCPELCGYCGPTKAEVLAFLREKGFDYDELVLTNK